MIQYLIVLKNTAQHYDKVEYAKALAEIKTVLHVESIVANLDLKQITDTVWTSTADQVLIMLFLQKHISKLCTDGILDIRTINLSLYRADGCADLTPLLCRD